MAEPAAGLVGQGWQALLAGRLRTAERLAAEAARLCPGSLGPGLLDVATCREQGRGGEAEVRARDLVALHPGSAEAQALLAAVLADAGRDWEAGQLLAALAGGALGLAALPPTAAALAAEVAAVLDLPVPAEALHARLAPLAGEVVVEGGAGSPARHVGLLAHARGLFGEAERRFVVALAANEAAGAPVVAAHTRRHYSALLRARGDEGDWERAIALLTEATAVYRRLEIDSRAEEAEAVLRRSAELDDRPDGTEGAVFRRARRGWELAFGGAPAVVVDGHPGLDYVAVLVAAGGRPVHAVDLAGGLGAAQEQAVAAIRARLGELEEVDDALAGAERDLLLAELEAAAAPSLSDTVDRARRLVALRIRTGLDRVEPAAPALARHLRRSIRTGTFCIYEPTAPRRWKMDG